MTNRFLLLFIKSSLFLAFFCCVFSAQEVRAQKCDAPYELIFKLRSASVGAYGVWDIAHGAMKTQERFIGSLALEDKTFLVGEREKNDRQDVFLTMNQLDKRGRIEWEKSHNIVNLSHVVKVLLVGERILVVGNVVSSKANNKIWLGFFKKDGSLISQKFIAESNANLEAYDIIRSHDEKALMLAAGIEKEKQAMYGAVYQLSNSGGVLTNKSYLPSPENKILGLSRYGEKAYVATGYVVNEAGNKTAWILGLNDNGGIAWQRQYPRGLGAELDYVGEYVSNSVIVAGTASPAQAGGGPSAGWVMMVDGNNGSILWQRYYSGEETYKSAGLLIGTDGLFSLLLNAQSADEDMGGFARMLTINPRGYLMDSEEFFNGKFAKAYGFSEGRLGHRVIVGSSNVSYIEEGDGLAEPAATLSEDGWVMSAVASDPYKDPCAVTYGAR